ncbi:MAG: efflux RND transporter periplasmic adaptor subunit [bacterium]
MMKICNKLFCLSFALLLLSSIVSMSCGKNGEAKNKNDEEASVLIPVEVAQVSQEDIPAFLTGTATLEAEEETEVVAKTSGIVEQILIEEGMFVKKGQILAKLEEEMLAIELQKAKADLNKLENDFQRNKELFQKNLISKEEFQNVRFQYEAQKAAFEKAKLNLKYASIRAPIAGVVAKRHIKTGNMVNLNQPVFKIVDFEHLIANLFVPEVEIRKIKIGQRAELNFDASNGTVFAGYVERISPIVDPNSGTVKVTITVKDKSTHIKPGMFARVRIIYDTHQNSLLIPKQAVLSEDGSEVVYTIQDSMATKRLVKTGYATESMVEIVEGLSLGESVVVVGQNGLKDSSKVEIVQ